VLSSAGRNLVTFTQRVTELFNFFEILKLGVVI